MIPTHRLNNNIKSMFLPCFAEFVLDEHSIHEASQPVAVANANIKSRSRIVKGLVQNTSAQESLELNLREMLLDLEERICVGGLGNLKVSELTSICETSKNLAPAFIFENHALNNYVKNFLLHMLA